ncbi:MAG: double-strand break repair protein AddB [Novosphingobium sp. 28-62-57]|uniref:PD-(D/E)XK nuclease family protein n=1 Tax=unclassified Novosphingobium TaxID=2644732 RepID=UPI000BCB59F2|nr:MULTISPECIES: PD-(D/E)XK nuclease family protein [unclassified Novosphingobium]OYW49612.1 MAG: double-strand break repair protein AddB [Novosphingobium sp. 12-62-10]OYZ12432.1 MAG: double-strand break repair protein AddB [Novosphingobium sp. 28-62-57]
MKSVPSRPRVWSIAAHRGFADALVAGLIPRYREDRFGLARLTLLLPSQRAVRTVTEAFVRASGAGLLLPRMAVVGDLDLDETLGPLLDPIGAGADIPAAVDPTFRLLRLAALLRDELGDEAPGEAALIRQAKGIAQGIDRLLVEGVRVEDMLNEAVVGIATELSEHWQNATRLFARVFKQWEAELEDLGKVDAPERRSRLLEHAAQSWKARPPAHPVIAAGVTSASPAVAKLLRVVADLPDGGVILPDLDLALDPEVWETLGSAGGPDGAVFERGDVVTHPQYHLKLLLNRMGIAWGEVEPWHRSGLSPAPPERSRAISNLFLPPEASAAWVSLEAKDRRLSGVRMMESANPEEEAQAIAVLVREALAQPERRVAVITPDRSLAARIVAHLARWNIVADDTAGRPLPQTAAGRVLLQLAELVAERAAPVPLLALLGHPLVQAGEGRVAWLERVRQLDLTLRGPRPGPGLPAIRQSVEKAEKRYPGLTEWWSGVEDLLFPIVALDGDIALDTALNALSEAGEALCGTGLWAQADGRCLAQFVERWRDAATTAPTLLAVEELPAMLRDAMEDVSVRPPYGGHPRLAIYGLLEARMSRADLVICGGLTEGTWPAKPAPDPLLAPPVLRALGIPGADFRIGLSAHDLAAALGAPEVVLSHAMRDASGPVIPSRFLLRIQAMCGKQLSRETRAVALAKRLADPIPVPPHPRPHPMPSAEQRKVAIAVTALDRLRGDPYQFYASAILGLRSLDPVDADPTPAWKGTAVHKILQLWHEAGGVPGQLIPIAEQKFDEMSAHPFMRAMWKPRLIDALHWIEEETDRLAGEGREVLVVEQKGKIEVDGITIHGQADRIDKLADGKLAVVDYKTGMPPSGRMVQEGYALQLGLIGMIASKGGMEGVAGEPSRFEYWSLARSKQRTFGYMDTPVLEGRKKSGIPLDQFLPETERYLREAIARWLLGHEPFTARLNPDLPSYTDYDQLMRLDEWQGREEEGKP